MKFIRDLLGKKRKEAGPNRLESIETLEQSYRDTIGSMVDETDQLRKAVPAEPQISRPAPAAPPEPPAEPVAKSAPAAPAKPSRPRTVFYEPTEPKKKTQAPVNIWDLEDLPGGDLPPAAPEPERNTALPEAPAEAPEAPAAARSPARSRRTKTRLIGFEKSDGAVVDLFNDAPATAAAPKAKSVKFPVGWIVVVQGPGRGECFTLKGGMSQIGRGDDQAIQLDFGDNSISRSNHAAIVYDSETKEFLLGHGGKSNIVRLNNKPVITNEAIKTGDQIKIGETVLRFIALCDKSFNWSDSGSEEDEDVAIA